LMFRSIFYFEAPLLPCFLFFLLVYIFQLQQTPLLISKKDDDSMVRRQQARDQVPTSPSSDIRTGSDDPSSLTDTCHHLPTSLSGKSRLVLVRFYVRYQGGFVGL
jgi:hypothetical protein